MKFYKENGVNPLGGCLPLLAQMPVFFALFNVLRAIAELDSRAQPPQYGLTTSVVESAQQAHIFGVHALRQVPVHAARGRDVARPARDPRFRADQRGDDVPDRCGRASSAA